MPETLQPPPLQPHANTTVRPATNGDAAGIAALLASIGWFPRYQRGDADTHAAQLQTLIDNAPGRSLLLVAECPDPSADNTPLMGYCAVHWLPVAVQLGEEAYVSELFVHESARGTGAGSLLLDAATAAARARGCARIWLVNNRQRPSYQRGFYAQHGWIEQPEMARFVLALS